MNNFELFLNFLLEIAKNSHHGSVILFLWLFGCLGICLLCTILVKILAVINATQKYFLKRSDQKLKRSIYHRFADIANSAVKDGKHLDASFIMTQCVTALYGGDTIVKETIKEGTDENATAQSDISTTRIEESISESCGQSSDRTPDGPKESFVEIKD